jgi:hypothetical protein
MDLKRTILAGVSSFCLFVAANSLSSEVRAQTVDPAIKITIDAMGGIVAGPKGPEAGVWVIAETVDLPTKFVKMVVTDDLGRYLIPELPKGKYKVWVRGYGLVDSPKVDAEPGKIINLTAVTAPNDAAAAEYYPALYWFSMLSVPDKNLFPGTGPQGNGMPISFKSQGQWLELVKTDGCFTCHQLGSQWTRRISKELGEFKTSVDAWERRIQSGQAMTQMAGALGRFDAPRALKHFADWTDRIAKGDLPSTKPQRPSGLERNVVISSWDWAEPTVYMHDLISTDKRNPTINANGKLYGSPEESTDFAPILDPVTHTRSSFKNSVRDPKTPSSLSSPMAPSPIWGDRPIWDSQTSMHNPMFDEKGRVWYTSRVGPRENPDFCKKGSDHASAKLLPLDSSNRHLSMYDPGTGKVTLIRTCFSTHHLMFAEDANNTLWTSAGGGGGLNPTNEMIGWFNRKVYEETGDEEKAQGWTAVVLDTSGDGKRGEYTEPGKPMVPGKDMRMSMGLYGLGVSPADGSIWGSVLGFPGWIIRMVPGDNPPQTSLSEVFELPWNDQRVAVNGYSPRGLDVDRNGVAWVPLASGHMASFDRRKCKGPLNGPNATGRHCPEGWTLTPFPGPQLQGVTDSGSAESSYYTWVDQRGVFGLGENVPFATGNANESIMALKDGNWINMRVPYPLGFYAKGMDARIDNAATGWKGRGLWTTHGTRTSFHGEGGKGVRPQVVKFQLRPDPLAN